jgi:periplasmic protein TonB
VASGTGTVKANLADRLSSTLFVAALAHGVVILGVTFATDPIEPSAELPSLNVTLLVDSADFETSREQQELLADRSVLGGGRTDGSERPTRTLSDNHPISQLGDPLGADLTDGTPADDAPLTDRLATRSESETRIHAVPDAPDQRAEVLSKAATLIETTDTDTRVAELAETAEAQRDDTDNGLSNPSTSESALAEYLVGWRQRVERIGTANFPAGYLTRRSQLGRPTLEVAIGPKGNLEDIVVRKSSGDSSLDEAALKILRMAAPFEPLPSAILAEYDVLRFAYEWDFASGDEPGPLAAAD